MAGAAFGEVPDELDRMVVLLGRRVSGEDEGRSLSICMFVVFFKRRRS